MMTAGGPAQVKADVNVTPLIDVLLVLLIIFMVITPLMPRGLQVLIPQVQRAGNLPESDALVVKVDRNHNYSINRDPVKESDLTRELAEISKTRVTKVVFIEGDPDVDYRYVAMAVDDAKAAGLDRAGIMPAEKNQDRDKQGRTIVRP